MRLRLILAVTVCILTMATHAANASDWDILSLMQMLAQEKSGKATFIEKQYLAMLDTPLESTGELYFTAPDHLEKRTLKPKPEALILDGDKLLIERSNGRKITISLADRPEVSAFVESIRATLAGDRVALEHFYTLALTGNAEHWQLKLTPTQPRMLKVISQIRIEGARAVVKTIVFMQADGDHSEMTITMVDTQ